MEIEQFIVGFTAEGEVVLRYTLSNASGMRVDLLNIGAAVESITSPQDVALTLSYPSYTNYLTDSLCMGKVVGRYAGRIAKGKLSVKGESYKLNTNEGTTHLRGGIGGLSTKLWQGRSEEDMLVFSYISPEGEEGYPAELGMEIGYTLTDNNELIVTHIGASNAATVVSTSSFIYFTLGAEASVQVNSKARLTLDKKLIPTGEVEELSDANPYSLEVARTLDTELEYDDYYLINKHKEQCLNEHCSVVSKEKGVRLSILSTHSALYLNSCDDIEGCGFNAKGEELTNREGLLLAPMSVAYNNFDTLTIEAEQTYHHQIRYKFEFFNE